MVEKTKRRERECMLWWRISAGSVGMFFLSDKAGFDSSRLFVGMLYEREKDTGLIVWTV